MYSLTASPAAQCRCFAAGLTSLVVFQVEDDIIQPSHDRLWQTYRPSYECPICIGLWAWERKQVDGVDVKKNMIESNDARNGLS